jgi:5-hydroxyisourate hydrolase-like protein (transthyretin family)
VVEICSSRPSCKQSRIAHRSTHFARAAVTPLFRLSLIRNMSSYAALLCGAIIASTVTTTVRAQEAREVQGRVVKPAIAPAVEAGAPRGADSASRASAADTAAVTPVPGVMVTLHRVGSDSEAPIDSVRTRPDGKYSFKYKTSGAANAVYFTSVTWDNVTYFTAPLRTARVSGDAAEITVFDATTESFPLKVAGRHLIVSAPDTTNHRTVIEVFELSNDSMKTLSSGDEKSGKPTWSVVIPNIARDVKANEGEISAAAFAFANNRVSIYSAIAPGIKQVSFSYRVPNEAFPMSFELEGGAVVMEVLLEDPNGTVTGAGLIATNPQAIENRTFRRFLAQDVPNGATIDVNLPAGPSVGRNMYVAALLGTIGVIMLMILLRTMQRNKKPSYVGIPPVQTVEAPLADRLAREIADLDATFAKYQNPTDAVRNAYEERRAELKDALAAEMARG